MFYMDGAEKRSVVPHKSRLAQGPTGDGRIVIGRYNTDQDKEYSSVHIDELIYFNIH